MRRHTAPRLILLDQPDAVITVGAVAAWRIYGRGPAVAVLTEWTPVPSQTRLELQGDRLLVAEAEQR